MANVHRLGDYDSQPPGQPFPGQQQGNAQGYGNGQRGPQGQQVLFFGSGGGDGASPYPPINKVLAPNFEKYSFIFFISLVQILMFAAELIVGQSEEDGAFVKENEMAGPSTETMKIMGGKWVPSIQRGQIYRFLTPAVLHAGILHIFTNLVSQTMIGYTAERNWGSFRMICFYFGTAFGASLLSCVGSPCVVSVGASGALLGVIGCQMVWILVNWSDITKVVNPCQQMCTLFWWLFIIFMIGISMSGIDNWAHFGGWLSGVMLGFAFHEWSMPVSWLEGKEKRVRLVFLALSIAYFLSLLLSTFLAVGC